MELSRFERTMLANQLRILQAVAPETYHDFDDRITVLESGYELHYNMVLVEDRRLPADRCEWVLNVLNMYRAIWQALQRLSPTHELQQHHAAHFRGFDGNNEGAEMLYTEFLLSDLGRFEELHRPGGYNTHSPTLDSYQRMLDKWESLGNLQQRFEMDEEQLREVLQAVYMHPGRS